MSKHVELKESPLGKETVYTDQYQPNLLFAIARKTNRELIHVPEALPFCGQDIWTAFELSWLDAKGKPKVAIADFRLPCESPQLVESKSIKLYLNSFNNTKFESTSLVQQTIAKDLSQAAGGIVQVTLHPLDQYPEKFTRQFKGTCLDHLDIECDTYQTEPTFLTTITASNEIATHTSCARDDDAVIARSAGPHVIARSAATKQSPEIITETVYSDLLRSNCPITGQPDWGSVQISYTGKQIDHAGLLKYIVSLRNHDEFHEQCVERIFMDITTRCHPERLFVYARYTRRGGLDINPWRSSHKIAALEELRLCRQ